MTLKDFKIFLNHMDSIEFILPDGEKVMPHFHITEVGQLDRFFVDCGGTVRKTSKVNFQLYVANDLDHRLESKKLLKIIQDSETKLGINELLEIQVEYQGRSIELYEVAYEFGKFNLLSTLTDCLAKDKCGIPEKSIVENPKPTCIPGSGCC
jgi:hypothetical protein